MKNKNEKGFALVLSLVLMLAMSLMGGALIVISAGDHSANNQSDDYQQTFYVAETALLEGERHVLNLYLGPYKTDGTRDLANRILPINKTTAFNGTMTLGNYATSGTDSNFKVKYGTREDTYSFVSNGDICFNSFPEINRADLKVIEDKAKKQGAISNNYGTLLALAFAANGSPEEQNEAQKLKFYYYEFFVTRIGAAPFRGTGSSIKKAATDTGNDGMAYRIYGCGIKNGVGLDPMVVPLESVIVLPK
jgi:hypothetical protein|tara:strand:+ start:1207 stop:1953 length:747 start_codon:yes stop_codon:yes gene_type:complete